MQQLLKYLRDGKTIVAEVPIPGVRPGTALVRTSASLISAGTERTTVEFAEKNLLGKARSRPDLVRQVLDKMRREGIQSTLESVFNRLDQPMVLGYSSSGTIINTGQGLQDFHAGDRVACAGSSAVHSEYVVVPKNLLVSLPPQVDFESAAFTTLGAIAMHGFRLGQPQLGERVAIIGLGLLGLLSAGIARAAGCSVFGIDLDPQRVALGVQMGAVTCLRQDALSAGQSFTGGQGFDTVLICADTKSSDPIDLAAQLSRDRARIVAVGAVGLHINRKLYYEKELQLLISRSYGPGRYDPQYEQKGNDYPIGYVRWTENRNMQAFVGLLGSGRLDIKPLITHRIPIARAAEAYDLITGKTQEKSLGVLITYPASVTSDTSNLNVSHVTNSNVSIKAQSGNSALKLGVLGAGNYATNIFLPNVHKVGRIARVGIASSTGLSAHHAAHRFGFGFATSSEEEIFDNPDINVIAILDRHQHHARQVIKALNLGKHVYCEKPLALKSADLNQIASMLIKPGTPVLMVGFNRRFAPFTRYLVDFFGGRSEPLIAHYRVNAGFLPRTHWLHDPEQGGGRIIGEGCHFIDFLTDLVGTPPLSVSAHALPDNNRYCQDNVLLTFVFPDGSIGSVTYLANGNKSVPKEQVEVFCAGKVAILDDFRRLELIKEGSHKVYNSYLRQDKGHIAAWIAFLNALKDGTPPPILYDHIINVSQAAITASEAVTNRNPEAVPIPAAYVPQLYLAPQQ